MKKLFPLPFLCYVYFAVSGFSLPINPEVFSDKNDKAASACVFFGDSSTDKVDISVSTGLSHARAGFNHMGGILLESNNLNIAYSLSLTVRYDTTSALISIYPSPVTSVPGLMTFYFDSLQALEQKFIFLEFSTPTDTSLLGHNLWLQADVTTTSYDVTTNDNTDSSAGKIYGSADPNSKTVFPEGFGFPNYVPVTQEEFKYTIDFQNTGTDTAVNITITDTISNYLDPFTIKPGASSHPYSWEILSPGILKFHFNNIFLPDSNTNEPRSHGFVTFTIKARQGLTVGTNIKNMVNIFFDFNSPVATNTTSNELYDCNNIANFALTQSNICGGDLLSVNQITIIPHTSFWYVDSNWQATGDTFLFSSLVAGSHQIILEAHTPYCIQIISQAVTVSVPSRPDINQNGYTVSTTLSAMAYQWFLNGVMIPGAQAISYQAQVAGWYSVIITDAMGCNASSDSVFVSDVGIPVIKNNEILSADPNPFRDQLQITSWINETAMILLMDMQGRILKSEIILPGVRQIQMDTRKVHPGIYTLKLYSNGFSTSRLVSKF